MHLIQLLLHLSVFSFLMGFGRFLVSSLLVFCSINLVLLEISRIIKFFRNGDSNVHFVDRKLYALS